MLGVSFPLHEQIVIGLSKLQRRALVLTNNVAINFTALTVYMLLTIHLRIMKQFIFVQLLQLQKWNLYTRIGAGLHQ